MFTVRSFLKAAERGETETVRQYLQGRDARECIAGTDGEGNTALHLAASAGHLDIVKLLLAAGSDVDTKNESGYTPLARVAVFSHSNTLPVAEALLAAGADPNVELHNHESVLTAALSQYNANPALAELLIESKADLNIGTPLLKAAEQRLWDIAEKIVRLGGNPEAMGQSNYRAIHYAAQHGQENLVRALIEKGADVNVRQYYKDTPLHLAIDQGDAKMVKLLLDNGARVDLVDKYSRDALAHARKCDNAREITALVEPVMRALIAKRTTPLNATAEELPFSDAETWVLMGEQKIARVSVHPALLRRLTEVFNFESRDRFVISENLRTRAETITAPVSFDATPEPLLEKALKALRDLGGQADEEDVFGARMPKKTLKPSPGAP